MDTKYFDEYLEQLKEMLFHRLQKRVLGAGSRDRPVVAPLGERRRVEEAKSADVSGRAPERGGGRERERARKGPFPVGTSGGRGNTWSVVRSMQQEQPRSGSSLARRGGLPSRGTERDALGQPGPSTPQCECP
jgi:hypothetical protein